MTCRWTTLQMLGLTLFLLAAVGCGPKAPDTPSEDMTNTETSVATPPPEEITPPSDPVPAEDRVRSPLDGSLQEANRYAYDRGLLGEVYFDFDKSDLSTVARERLAKNATFLNENRKFGVTIEGHCDERGTNEYNLALGERRANAALDYLVSLGVSRNRLRIISYGEERPSCRQSSESCWSRNRRAYFLISSGDS